MVGASSLVVSVVQIELPDPVGGVLGDLRGGVDGQVRPAHRAHQSPPPVAAVNLGDLKAVAGDGLERLGDWLLGVSTRSTITLRVYNTGCE